MKKTPLIILFASVLLGGFLLGSRYLKSGVRDNSTPQSETKELPDTNQSSETNQTQLNQPLTNNFLVKEFNGETGEAVLLGNGEIKLTASIFSDNQARFYNVKMPDNKVIYFFVVKDKNGIYHAAANACQVCFSVRKGFHQEGNEIVCDNCGNRYPLEKIATEKGGCNPAPINPNLTVKDGKLTIKQAELQEVAGFF
jgi:hypothetical protein